MKMGATSRRQLFMLARRANHSFLRGGSSRTCRHSIRPYQLHNRDAVRRASTYNGAVKGLSHSLPGRCSGRAQTHERPLMTQIQRRKLATVANGE
jgi:hypothetical protein